MSYFVGKANHSTSLVDPGSPLPNEIEAGKQVGNVLKRWFAIFMAMNTNRLELLPQAESQTVPGFQEIREQRMFFAPYLF